MISDAVAVPRSAAAYGLRLDPTGTHLSSTLRLEDLELLLRCQSTDATVRDYRRAVVEENQLGKPTVSARHTAFERLRELYGLNPDLMVFRALRDLWDTDAKAQPSLALLCSTARDPILRALTPLVLRLSVGARVVVEQLAEEAESQFPGKFVPSSRKRLARNATSTWRKTGLVQGRRVTRRSKVDACPASVAYALLLGDMCGRRGQGLFSTVWTAMLDAPLHEMKALAVKASQQGWIEHRASGDVVEVSFRYLMRDA